MKAFFVVFGDEITKDMSNVKVIETKVIPNIGEQINFQDKNWRVKDKLISYKQVEGYDIKDPDRGGEMIYCFV